MVCYGQSTIVLYYNRLNEVFLILDSVGVIAFSLVVITDYLDFSLTQLL